MSTSVSWTSSATTNSSHDTERHRDFDFAGARCYNREQVLCMGMKLTNGFVGLAAVMLVALAGVFLSGCQSGVTGPSLAATVQGVTLQPTVVGLVGGENVCCCHIRGTVTNQSTVAVHAELRFEAKGASGQALGMAAVMEQNIQPGATRAFVAVGITAACREVSLAQVVADKQIRLKGLWEPPA